MNPVKCPKCGKINDGHLDFCIYCGAIFEEANGIVTDLRNTGRNKDSYSPYDSITYPNDERRSDERDSAFEKPKTLYRYLVIIGYITAILGGVLGFIISIFLITRKDLKSNEHNPTRESDSECKCKFNQHIWIVSYLFFLI